MSVQLTLSGEILLLANAAAVSPIAAVNFGNVLRQRRAVQEALRAYAARVVLLSPVHRAHVNPIRAHIGEGLVAR